MTQSVEGDLHHIRTLFLSKTVELIYVQKHLAHRRSVRERSAHPGVEDESVVGTWRVGETDHRSTSSRWEPTRAAAWVSGALPDAPPVREVLLDIDELNSLAQEEGADVVKVSFHALGHLLDRYSLLRSGGALGRGCGPLLVAREENAAVVGRLEDISVAIPGELT